MTLSNLFKPLLASAILTLVLAGCGTNQTETER